MRGLSFARKSPYLLQDFEVFLIPIVNPDGRGALERSGDYCWRGNGDRVDFARNFDWNFGGAGSSGTQSHFFGLTGFSVSLLAHADRNNSVLTASMIDTAAGEDYRGPAAFSEPESRFVRDFARKHKIDVFMSIHSGISRVYLPFADSKVQIVWILLHVRHTHCLLGCV